MGNLSVFTSLIHGQSCRLYKFGSENDTGSDKKLKKQCESACDTARQETRDYFEKRAADLKSVISGDKTKKKP